MRRIVVRSFRAKLWLCRLVFCFYPLKRYERYWFIAFIKLLKSFHDFWFIASPIIPVGEFSTIYMWGCIREIHQFSLEFESTEPFEFSDDGGEGVRAACIRIRCRRTRRALSRLFTSEWRRTPMWETMIWWWSEISQRMFIRELANLQTYCQGLWFR